MFTEAILFQEATASSGQLNPGTVHTSHNSSTGQSAEEAGGAVNAFGQVVKLQGS